MACAMRSTRGRSDAMAALRALAVIVGWLSLAGAGRAGGNETLADPASDAPQQRSFPRAAGPAVASYAEALRSWRRAEDLNAWLDARFEYDGARALRLSETQRARSGGLPIHEPQAFFDSPRGICVDVARFAVESLRMIDPLAKAGYLMIEFDPATRSGHTLRRHWVATFQRDGQLYVFGDSKRPGHLAGPYADVAAFVADYARYRGRQVVAFRQLQTFERQRRQLAKAQAREAVSPPPVALSPPPPR